MKRTKEITIIHYRRRRVKKRRGGMVGCCPVCGSNPDMVTVSEAASLVRISRSTIYSWIKSNQVHSTRLSSGQLHICHRSLLLRVAQRVLNTDEPD